MLRWPILKTIITQLRDHRFSLQSYYDHSLPFVFIEHNNFVRMTPFLDDEQAFLTYYLFYFTTQHISYSKSRLKLSAKNGVKKRPPLLQNNFQSIWWFQLNYHMVSKKPSIDQCIDIGNIHQDRKRRSGELFLTLSTIPAWMTK